LIFQEKALRDKILAYENENNGLDGEISSIYEDITVFDGRIMDAQNHIKNLQADIAESGALCDKYKSEALHYQKATQSEIMKNNDTTKLLSQAEHMLKTRISQS
jgi:predicted RNase H-like nuclease (RuvC/YqgF family)